MIPRILEFEDGRVKITAEAYTIPEIKAIIDKYDMQAEPYLSYVGGLSYPDSPYVRLPLAERADAAIYDVKETLGDFDEEDELIQPAIDRLRSLWESANTLLADELEEEIHRWRKFLRDNPINTDSEGNKDRLTFLDKAEKYATSARNVRKMADEEIGTKMKGSNEMGEY